MRNWTRWGFDSLTHLSTEEVLCGSEARVGVLRGHDGPFVGPHPQGVL